MADTRTLVLLRHGESIWNRENRFTGWVDVDLTAKGEADARAAGTRLVSEGFAFDVAYTSVLKRAIRTLHLATQEMDQLWIPVEKSWRLNERHYGKLQGLDKAQTSKLSGEAQVRLWRRSWDVPPPPIADGAFAAQRADPRYVSLRDEEMPRTECLKDTVTRFLPFWHGRIVPQLQAHARVLVVAHGNSLRALVKHLDGISDDAIVDLNIPTAQPLLYVLDPQMKKLESRYLDPAAAAAAAEEVARQAKPK